MFGTLYVRKETGRAGVWAALRWASFSAPQASRTGHVLPRWDQLAHRSYVVPSERKFPDSRQGHFVLPADPTTYRTGAVDSNHRRRVRGEPRGVSVQRSVLGSSLTPLVFPEYSRVRPAISNSNPTEQALIHRGRHDVHGSCDRLVSAYDR